MHARERVLVRTSSRQTGAGFCRSCGIFREDFEGVPVTDCVCTALMNHLPSCRYVRAVSMWIPVHSCEAHGLDACEDCDCNCDGPLDMLLESQRWEDDGGSMIESRWEQ